MRLAGCERLSLGVESGSQAILDAIDKKITADEIIASTELAKKWGIKVRYYMMVGNRGETRATFDETLRFLERAKPHQYIFAALSVYPGTRDYDLACEAGWLDARVLLRERLPGAQDHLRRHATRTPRSSATGSTGTRGCTSPIARASPSTAPSSSAWAITRPR